jgi:hypothetical protein
MKVNRQSRAALAVSRAVKKAQAAEIERPPRRSINLMAPCPNIPNPTIDRQLRAWSAWTNAKRAWALYDKTKKFSHAWDAYRAWRKIAPSDLPLPREILGFLDQFAAAQLGSESNGGSLSHAERNRRERDIAEWILGNIQAAESRSPKRGYKKTIYAAAEKKFKKTTSEIANIVHEFQLAKRSIPKLR